MKRKTSQPSTSPRRFGALHFGTQLYFMSLLGISKSVHSQKRAGWIRTIDGQTNIASVVTLNFFSMPAVKEEYQYKTAASRHL